MKEPNDLFADYARVPVPSERRVKGWHIVVIYVGVALTLPAFLTGGQIGVNLGFTGGVVATSIAALILAAVGSVTGYVGAKTGLSTYMIARFTFGNHGAKITNFVIAVTLFGWFGVTTAFFAQATDALATGYLGIALGELAWTMIGTVLMISTAVFGFKGLDRLSIVVTPLLFVLLLAAVQASLASTPFTQVVAYDNAEGFGLGAAVSILVGAWMVGAVVLPDVSRYAVTPRHGLLGGGSAFICGMVVVIVPCIVIAIANESADVIAIVVSFGWAAWALVIIFLSAWSSNDNNVYSAALSLATIFRGIDKWKLTVAAGAAGGVLAALGIAEQLVPFLMALGILVPPVAGIFATDYFIRPGAFTGAGADETASVRWQAFAAWIAASTFAYCTQPAPSGGLGLFSLTMIPALDALAVSSGAYVVLHRLSDRRPSSTA